MLAAIGLAVLGLVGHAAFWVGAINRIHAIGASRRLIDLTTWSCRVVLIGLPIAAAAHWRYSGLPFATWIAAAIDDRALRFYLLPCWIVALLTIWFWIARQAKAGRATALETNHTDIVDVAATLNRKPVSGRSARLLAQMPGNQIFQLAKQEKQLRLARLPKELDGLSIVHLSDLHITGRIQIDFFHEVIRLTQALRPDLIAITGDIVDDVELLDWLPATLARLSAPLGIHFVLGNHDQYTGQAPKIRSALIDAGLTDLGGRWQRLDVAAAELVLAGNELPWFGPAAMMDHCPPRDAGHPQLRLLLAHSPDQFAWARRLDFDLMLAGHTHGGQICLPIIGPIHCPSWHGVKYASGVFHQPPTVMHVSRGVSSELPIRLNCRPEVTKLVLRAG